MHGVRRKAYLYSEDMKIISGSGHFSEYGHYAEYEVREILSKSSTVLQGFDFKYGVPQFLSTECDEYKLYDKSGSFYEGPWSQYQTLVVSKDNGFDMKQLNP